MKYTCVNCGYTIDESLWDPQEWYSEGTMIGSIEKCPVCGTYDSFQWIEEEINIIEGPDEKLFWLEKEHNPCIEIKQTNWQEILEVSVPHHSSEEGHRISSISLYDEYNDLIEEHFIPSWSYPAAQFEISSFDEFRLVVRCNLHGLWSKSFER